MSVEITTADTFDKVVIEGDMDEVVAALNQASSQATRWVVFKKFHDGNLVAFDTKNLRRLEHIDDGDLIYRG